MRLALELMRRIRMRLIEFALCHYHTCYTPIRILNWFALLDFPIVLCRIGAKDTNQMQNNIAIKKKEDNNQVSM